MLAGTPIPSQPIPAGAGVTSAVSVTIEVVVDASGNVTSASVATSSGNATIDHAALAIVRASLFRPGLAGCGSTPNSATVTVNFIPAA